MLSQLLHFREDMSSVRDLGHMALAELHHNGGFQPQMATESGRSPRGGIEKLRSAQWASAHRMV